MMTTFPRTLDGYEVPNFCDTSEGMDRVLHRDVPALTTRELIIEKIRVERALARAHGRSYCVVLPNTAAYMRADEWLIERLTRIAVEMRRRRGVKR